MTEEIPKKIEKDDLEGLLTDFSSKLTTSENLLEDKKSLLLEGLKTQIKSYFYFPNWLNDNEREKYNKDKKALFSVLTDKVEDISSMTMEDSEVKNIPMEIICKKMCHLFLYVDLGNPIDEIRDLLQKSMDFVEQCEDRKYITKSYTEGFYYLFNGLEALAFIQAPKDHVSFEELEILISKMKDYIDISLPSQSVVLAVKQNFIGQFDKEAYSAQLVILDQVLKLDVNPEYMLWVYQIWRYKRKANWGNRQPPGVEEIEAIVDAVNQFPDHPHVGMAFCNVIAESIKDKHVLNTPLVFGTLSFRNIQDVIEFLHSETRRVLSMDPMSVFTNITAAEIFQSILQKKFHNLNFAKMCIERALLFHPNSSKANVRMGMLSLTNKDFEDATKYFEFALESDPRNFPCFLELISTYFRNVMENKENIIDLFNTSSIAATWGSAKLGTISWFEGIFHYACDDDKKAIEAWIQAYLKHQDSILLFKKIGYYVHRYGWDSSCLSLSLIKSRIERVMQTKDAKTEFIVLKILNILNEGLKEEKAYFSRRGGRGYSGGRGGHGDRGRGSSRARGHGGGWRDGNRSHEGKDGKVSDGQD